MNGFEFTLSGARLVALPSGALWWPAQNTLTVSDLHLGKSDRLARRNGLMFPPYDTRDTLNRLDADIGQTNPDVIICLGDSFDDLEAANNLGEGEKLWVTHLQAARHWFWIEGNHDPGGHDLGGSHRSQLIAGPLTFRHIAQAGEIGEISGHYHPKTSLSTHGRTITRPCFLYDRYRVIMPAYGTYTGGLRSSSGPLLGLMGSDAQAILTGQTALAVPLPYTKPTR